MTDKTNKIIIKTGFIILGLILLSSGLLTLKANHLFYSNYRGAAVFAPFTIIIGAIFLVIGIFRKDII
jgi:heme/copper-type cytochrome/quinol oxidase subunit 3